MTENHPEILTGDQIKDLNDAKRGENFGHTFAHVLEKGRIQEEPYEPAKKDYCWL